VHHGGQRHPDAPAQGERLADAAERYTRAGWPVLPVRLPIAARPPGVAVPALRPVGRRLPPDPATAREWWSECPRGIAAPTGIMFDVLVLPEAIGRRTLESFRTCANLIAHDPAGWWWFFVTPGSSPVPDFPRGHGVTLLGGGALVPLPPTPLPAHPSSPTTSAAPIPLTWDTSPPDSASARLPHSLSVQWAAVKAFAAPGPPVPDQPDDPDEGRTGTGPAHP
jgi:hypothetical protein